ncbi:MAG: VanZ family protein [Desulfobaccales bacterium]
MGTLFNSIFWRYWAPPLVWALIILGLSGDMGAGQKTYSLFNWVISWIVTLDLDALGLLHFRIRKVMHVLCYGVLSVLWFRALMASYPHRLKANILLALGLCLAVSAADESSQFLSASRTGSLWDVGLDITGGVLFLFPAVYHWKRKNLVPSEVKAPLS